MTQDLERVHGREIAQGFDGATVTTTSLAFDAGITEERAGDIVGLLGRIDRSAKWWLGDWMLQARALWGDAWASQTGSDRTGYSETALDNWRFVTETIPPEMRDDRLDFTTYIELAKVVRGGGSLEKVAEIRDRLIQMRETWTRQSGRPFPNHKVARDLVSEVMANEGMDLQLFNFPTSDEQIAEQAIEITRLRTELEDTQVSAGLAVRCPRCRRTTPVDQARVRPRTDQQELV